MKKRILFVDNEPRVVRGLQRMLRGMRNEWEMSFAEGGEQAQTLLSEASFDVVVSDVGVRAKGTAELLSEVAARHPAVVRIVLSGNADQTTIMRTTEIAHQYLSKPCNADVLRATVQRACALRDLLNSDRLKGIAAQVKTLPSQPSLYASVMEELRLPEPSVTKLGRIVEADVGMTAKILQLVNSSFFGMKRRISSTTRAAQLLGTETIRALTLSVGVFSQFKDEDLEGLNVAGLWEHSSMVGGYARMIARAEGAETALQESCFMAGLLHDTGMLILAANLPEARKETIRCQRESQAPLHDAERVVLGTTHAELGAYLLGIWGLPDEIVEAVAFHHTPSRCPLDTFTATTAVHAANAIANAEPAEDGTDVGIDTEHLAAAGLADRLPHWREACHSEEPQ